MFHLVLKLHVGPTRLQRLALFVFSNKFLMLVEIIDSEDDIKHVEKMNKWP